MGAMAFAFRTASPDERAWYERPLYPLQDRILRLAATYGDALVLTGGTALARLYLHHRFSDDLDLFTARPKDGDLGRDFLNLLRAEGFAVDEQLRSEGFVRATASDGSVGIQIDVAPDNPRIDPVAPSQLGVWAHSLREIGANKVSAVEDRFEIKDALDLYFLERRMPLAEMFADAEHKRVPLAYEALAYLREREFTGNALLQHDLDGSDFEAFLARLRIEIESAIQKKTDSATAEIGSLVASLLWDTPREARVVSSTTLPVLRRRMARLPLPQRLALDGALSAYARRHRETAG